MMIWVSQEMEMIEVIHPPSIFFVNIVNMCPNSLIFVINFDFFHNFVIFFILIIRFFWSGQR
jgi:hypothetical protein